MITIWDKIFESLWLSLDESSMKLAGLLLSDKEQLSYWWETGWSGVIEGKISKAESYGNNRSRIHWGKIGDYLKVNYHYTEVEALPYLKTAYEKWKNRNNSVE